MKNKIKIRLEISSLANKSISGVGNYTKQMAEAMSESSDVNLDLCYFDFLNRQPKPIINGSTNASANTLVPLRLYAKLQSYNLAWPFDILKSKVDLTIFPNFATWPTARSRFSATTIHDLAYIYYPKTVEAKNLEHLRRTVPETLKKASLILTVSEAVKSEIIKEFKIDPKRIIVTYNTADEIFYEKKSDIEIDRVKKKYKISSKKYIYFIGNFEPRKNLANLIKAYCQLPDKIKNEYGLVLAGGKGWQSGEAEQELERAAGSSENVIHIGYIDQQDSPALYQGASLFVFPSIYEGFGIPILEAMASGCPVIASDIPVLREAAGDAAVFFSPMNTFAMSECIQTILENKPKQNELVKLGHKNLSRFNWNENIDRLLGAVDDLNHK